VDRTSLSDRFTEGDGTVFSRRSHAADEKRILDYVESQRSMSETPISLARKLHLDARLVRAVLDRLVDEGKLRRRSFEDIEPVYYRFPSFDDKK
jgi:hypothetical protein